MKFDTKISQHRMVGQALKHNMTYHLFSPFLRCDCITCYKKGNFRSSYNNVSAQKWLEIARYGTVYVNSFPTLWMAHRYNPVTRMNMTNLQRTTEYNMFLTLKISDQSVNLYFLDTCNWTKSRHQVFGQTCGNRQSIVRRHVRIHMPSHLHQERSIPWSHLAFIMQPLTAVSRTHGAHIHMA